MQQTRVRPSNVFLGHFSLSMVKSSGFGSNLYNYIAQINTQFLYAYINNLSSLYKLTCWTLIQKVRYHIKALTAY